MKLAERLGRYIVPMPTTNGSNGNTVAAGNEPPQVKALRLSPSAFSALPGYADWIESALTKPRGRAAFAAAALAYICIKYRVTKLVEPPVIVVEEDEAGNESWIPDHEASRLLARPNADMSMRRLMEMTQVYLDTTGQALWIKSRDRLGRPAALYPFSGDDFSVRRRNADLANNQPARLYGIFKVNVMNADGRVESRDYPAEDVVYFSYFDPTDMRGGQAPLDAALAMLNIGHDLRTSIQAALKNSMMPSGAFSVEGELTDHQWERMLDLLESRQGPQGTGKPLLIENGGQWIEFAMTLKDLMAPEAWRMVEAVVASCFQVRPELLGLLVGMENSPWSHMSEARRIFYDDTIRPLWGFYADEITEQLLRPIDDDPRVLVRFDTSKVQALQADIEARSETAARMKAAWTVNDLRAYTGQEPFDDGDPRGQVIIGLAEYVKDLVASGVPPNQAFKLAGLDITVPGGDQPLIGANLIPLGMIGMTDPPDVL